MKFKIAGIQMLPRLTENDFNLDQILSYLEIVSKEGAQTRYFPGMRTLRILFRESARSLALCRTHPGAFDTQGRHILQQAQYPRRVRFVRERGRSYF